MSKVEDIYPGAERMINEIIRNEFIAQGHTLTGTAEASLGYQSSSTGKTDTMTGTMVDYAKYVRDGFPAESSSFRQFPFVYKYLLQRGYPDKEAKRFAAMTIRKWMKEGMSTQASKRFSSTGARQHFVESAFTGHEHEIDQYMSSSLDFLVDEEYHKEKSETI